MKNFIYAFLLFPLAVGPDIITAQPLWKYTLHKDAGFRVQNPIFPLNGVYIQIGKTQWDYSYSMLFYSNGSFRFGYSAHNRALGFDASYRAAFIRRFIDSVLADKNVLIHRGIYLVKGDTLITEYLGKNYDNLQWYVHRKKWLIRANGIFGVSETTIYRAGRTKPTPERPVPDSLGYTFFETPRKP